MFKYKLISVYNDSTRDFTIEADVVGFDDYSYTFYKQNPTNKERIAVVPRDKYILIFPEFIDNIKND